MIVALQQTKEVKSQTYNGSETAVIVAYALSLALHAPSIQNVRSLS